MKAPSKFNATTNSTEPGTNVTPDMSCCTLQCNFHSVILFFRRQSLIMLTHQSTGNNKIYAYNAHPGQARFQVFYMGIFSYRASRLLLSGVIRRPAKKRRQQRSKEQSSKARCYTHRCFRHKIRR